MTWHASDADRHRKDLTEDQKKKWASTANAVFTQCMASGGNKAQCEGKAVRIANSKINKPFNSGLSKIRLHAVEIKIPDLLTPDQRDRLNLAVDKCVAAGGDRATCLTQGLDKLRITGFADKKFQYSKITPPDPKDGHTHIAAYDENGDGATSEDGENPHNHMIRGFRVEPFYGWLGDGSDSEYVASVHPGSIAFEEGDLSDEPEDDEELGEFEMEIFRVGTHNGDDFSAQDLEDIAANFHKLKDELRPKLKITHRDEQETLAGLASYGDIVDVFMRKVRDGSRRLFARVSNVPKEVVGFVKQRRFPERSIELYPMFQLGTDEKSPIYKNVLKAVALLGHEMPAVTGMAPIMLEECLECQGTVCFVQSFSAKKPDAPAAIAPELVASFSLMRESLSQTMEEVKSNDR